MDHTRYVTGETVLSNETCSLSDDDFVCINVSGMRYETLVSTLERFPLTLLGNKARRMKYFVKSKNCYFFDRSSQCFEAILHYYQTGGVLIRPPHIPMPLFTSEIEFFGLGKGILASLREKEGYISNVVYLPKHPWQKKIWLLFEVPDSSIEARVLATWSMFVIAVSIFIFCMETMPLFQKQIHTQHLQSKVETTNLTHYHENSEISYTQPWLSLELSCVAWFTMEYLVRFVSSPYKWKFFKSFLNIIDLLAILPYFIILSISNRRMSPLLRVVRLGRVFRVFKLSRHSIGLQILGHTLRTSIRELAMLIFFLGIAVILFSSAIYYAEQGRSHMFQSIPDAFWYSVVTMTTVGYGDKTPTTLLGKIIGSMCAVSGVLTIALPVPVIVSNFQLYYKRDRMELKEHAVTITTLEYTNAEMDNAESDI